MPQTNNLNKRVRETIVEAVWSGTKLEVQHNLGRPAIINAIELQVGDGWQVIPTLVVTNNFEDDKFTISGTVNGTIRVRYY